MTRGAPVQVWATWFPREGEPETFIQEYGLESLQLAPRRGPFFLEAGASRIKENSCRGEVEERGKSVVWDLRYNSHFGATLSNKGWIGFSRTPHSDGVFSGEIRLGDRVFRGDPLGVGVQGHNCGFRHRNFWTWMHACFPQGDGTISTLEALVYEMPLGLVFRKAILWHRGRAVEFRKLRETRREKCALRWVFTAGAPEGLLQVEVEGDVASVHRLQYVKTDCSGKFEVSNNSRALARVRKELRGSGREELTTEDGAVVEMTGEYRV